MKIVQVLSQNHLTGAEVYACQLSDELIQNGHEVIHFSNQFFYPTKAKKIELPIEVKNSSEFNKSVQALLEFVTTQNVHVLHAHSRAAAKICKAVAALAPVAYVSTLHGRQHFSWSKRFMNSYGHYQIAICENVYAQLVQEFKYRSEKIKILRNGLDAQKYPVRTQDVFLKKSAQNLKIAIIGRLTGPKKNRTEAALLALDKWAIKHQTHLWVDVVGDTHNKLEVVLKNINLKVYNIENLNSEAYQKFDLIIGSGRVVMEALVAGVPVVAFGEATFEGLITEVQLKKSLASNFGDIALGSFGSPLCSMQDFEEVFLNYFKLESSSVMALSLKASELFSVSHLAVQVENVYRAARLELLYSKWIPILMYHKVPDKALSSPHQIFVTKDRFEKHLQFFKNQKFETLTFSELEAFIQGTQPLKKFPKKPLILTFDDGYLDNLKNAQPLLKKYGFKAQLFLLAEKSLTHNYWDEENIQKGDALVQGSERQAWLETQFEIGSHGLKHSKLTEMSSQQIYNELTASKRQLESEFKTPMISYAYTYGLYTEEAVKLAEKARYKFAVCTDEGGLLLQDELFRIFRVNVFPHENNFSLLKKTSSFYRRYYFWKRKK